MNRHDSPVPASIHTPGLTVHRGLWVHGLLAVALVVMGALAVPASAQTQTRSAAAAAAAHPTSAYWRDIKGALPVNAANGARPAIKPNRFRAAALDRLSMAGMIAVAPLENSQAARQTPMVISLPDPSGGFQRFSIVESPVMEPGLAAKHPNIKTYAGRGIDDATANLRMDLTPLGFHASVRSAKGSWYIDPHFHLDDSVYVSYFARDLPNPRAPFVEGLFTEPQVSLSRGRFRAAEQVQISAVGFAPGASLTISVRSSADAAPRQTQFATASGDGTLSARVQADPYRNAGSYSVTVSDGRNSGTATYEVVADDASTDATVGPQLRVYRLALITDPSYGTYFGGGANVTAAKVTLVNRLTQVYESETSIRLVLVANNDLLNLDTAALATGANGPCGGTACFTAATLGGCGDDQGLERNRIVIGLLIGASNYDIGHLALGVDGGGVATLGVVGRDGKARGCTGVPTPVGDFFAVDYVAHEMGHQFAGNHTFNGTVGSCSTTNRNSGTSVEPGSGSSIMAYAGICGRDNLQPHSDAYWSQRSFDEITTYISGAENTINEVQMAVMRNFTNNGQSFRLRWNGVDSAPITRGSKVFTAIGIKSVIEQIAGWPAGGTVAISAITDTGFTITYGGTLAGTNVQQLQLVNCTGACTGYVGELTRGGLTNRGGNQVTATGNTGPTVTVPPTMTIPVRTPFALTGSATDPEGDTLTYMWEQNDRGATGTTTGTGLLTQPKLNGPLFRQFGTRAVVSSADTLLYNSPGENVVTTNPTRVFPDLVQVLDNNTNAETGACTLAVPTAPTPAEGDCFSEFLPTAAYIGTTGVNASPVSLNFRLTVRDGRGGVNSANTQLILAASAGPFLVTSPNTAVTLAGGSSQTVTWSVAGTNAAPVSTSNVKISLSTDGGLTYPTVLAASTPNTGSATVTLPNISTTTARIKVEAVGNVFFDVSNANFTIAIPAVTAAATSRR